MNLTQVLALIVFTGAYVLIATERIPRTAAALGGAGVMLALGLTDGETAYQSADAGIDWNVIFLLLGMMIIVEVVRTTGLFEFLAIYAVKRARGRPFPVLALLVVITAVASALLDNVTTVLLIAPVTFLVCDRLGLNPVPYLIAEVLASNIGGTATLIGDPPNIIIASRAGLSFNDFLINLGPFILVMTVVFVGLCRWLFRDAFVADPARIAEVMELSEHEAIRDRKLLVQSLVVLTLVMAGFVLHTTLHVLPSVVALLGAGVLVVISRIDTPDAIADVEWETLVFFAASSSWSGRWSRPASSSSPRDRSPTPPAATSCWPWCCSSPPRRSQESSTTSPSSPRWPRSSPTSTRVAPHRPGHCGGPSRWVPTSAATPPPSVPAPTSSSSASPPATAPHQLLDLHPLRRRRRRGVDRARSALPVAALLRSRLSLPHRARYE